MKSIRITKQLISNFSVYNRANIYSNNHANKSLLAENGEFSQLSANNQTIQILAENDLNIYASNLLTDICRKPIYNFRGFFGNNGRKNNDLENDKEREDEESMERADRDDSDDEDNEDKDDSDSDNDNDNDDEGDLLMPVVEWIGGLIPKLAEMK